MSVRSIILWGMRRLLLLSACLAALGVATAGGASVARVAWVSDGDTIVLTNRAHVRLLQIDTPEVGSGECYSRAAARELRRLLPVGTAVRLEADRRRDGLVLRQRARQVRLEARRRAPSTSRAPWLLGACKAVWNPYAPATTIS